MKIIQITALLLLLTAVGCGKTPGENWDGTCSDSYVNAHNTLSDDLASLGRSSDSLNQLSSECTNFLATYPNTNCEVSSPSSKIYDPSDDSVTETTYGGQTIRTSDVRYGCSSVTNQINALSAAPAPSTVITNETLTGSFYFNQTGVPALSECTSVRMPVIKNTPYINATAANDTCEESLSANLNGAALYIAIFIRQLGKDGASTVSCEYSGTLMVNNNVLTGTLRADPALGSSSPKCLPLTINGLVN